MPNLYLRHQKLHCPKHSHHLPSVGILYHLLLRPATSHLLWFLWTSPHLSAPGHQHAAFSPPELQQYVILSDSFFLLALIKMMNVILQTSPIPLCSGLLVNFESLSPSLQDLFQLFNQQHWRQTKSSWASPGVHGINQICCCQALFFVLLGYLHTIFHLSHRTH